AIGPTTVHGTLLTEPIAKAGLQKPVEPPTRFFEHALAEFWILASRVQALCEAEQAINDLARIAQTLGQIPGIVPAAVDDDPLLAMNCGPVAVADSVHSGDRH